MDYSLVIIDYFSGNRDGDQRRAAIRRAF